MGTKYAFQPDSNHLDYSKNYYAMLMVKRSYREHGNAA